MKAIVTAITLIFLTANPVFAEPAGEDLQKIRQIIREELGHVDKRLEQMDKRFEELRTDVNKRFEELREDMNKRFEQVDKRFEQVDKRLEQVDKRFEQVDKRLEQVDKRFEQVNQQFEQMTNFLWILSGIFTAMTSIAIGFALWDRRTMVRPFEFKIQEMERSIREMDETTLKSIVSTLKDMAQSDSKLAAVLRSHNLL